ncbi:MAG: hypothetical protein ACE5DK_05195 [Paracoccaceae bacterium]
MKTPLDIALALGLALEANAAHADMVFVSDDTNRTLSFSSLIGDNDADGVGRMHLNNIQVPNLNLFRVNRDSVRGTVMGNAAGSVFVIDSSRRQVLS